MQPATLDRRFRALLAGLVAGFLVSSLPARAVEFARRDAPGDGQFPVGVALGDWDGDGDTDASLVFYSSGTVQLVRNDGGGAFVATDSLDASPPFGPWWAEGGDLDGDGDDDIAVAHLGSSELRVYENDGTGAFALAHVLPVNERPEYVRIADVNDDGVVDLLSPNESPELTIYLGDGSGGFVRAADVPLPSEEGHTVHVADFDGDGHVDVLVSFGPQPGVEPCPSRRPPVAIAYGDGTGAFPTVREQGAAMGYHAVVGDFDGDGSPDAATADLCGDTHEVRVLLNRGDGSGDLDLVQVEPVGTAHNDLTAAPLDCDEDLELIVADSDPDTGLVVLLNDGLGFFVQDPDSPVTSNGSPTAVKPAFLDADGFLDVAVSNSIENSYSAFLNLPDTIPPVLAGVPDDLDLDCTEAVPPPASPTATDEDCDDEPVVVFSETTEPGGCPDSFTLTRTWTTADCCGNVAEAAQVITVSDVAPPLPLAALVPLPPAPVSSVLSPRAPRSACSAPSSGLFVVACGAEDDCDPTPVTAARIVATRHELDAAGDCVEVAESVDVVCDAVVELRLVAPPCLARPASSARPVAAVTSDGTVVVHGESLRLEVTATDRCGNEATAVADPTEPAEPPCDEALRLDDGSCCPALAAPAPPGPADCCGR